MYSVHCTWVCVWIRVYVSAHISHTLLFRLHPLLVSRWTLVAFDLFHVDGLLGLVLLKERLLVLLRQFPPLLTNQLPYLQGHVLLTYPIHVYTCSVQHQCTSTDVVYNLHTCTRKFRKLYKSQAYIVYDTTKEPAQENFYTIHIHVPHSGKVLREETLLPSNMIKFQSAIPLIFEYK
jgi:hypothetical protein